MAAQEEMVDLNNIDVKAAQRTLDKVKDYVKKISRYKDLYVVKTNTLWIVTTREHDARAIAERYKTDLRFFPAKEISDLVDMARMLKQGYKIKTICKKFNRKITEGQIMHNLNLLGILSSYRHKN